MADDQEIHPQRRASAISIDSSSFELKKHNIQGKLEKTVGAMFGNKDLKQEGQLKVEESFAIKEQAMPT